MDDTELRDFMSDLKGIIGTERPVEPDGLRNLDKGTKSALVEVKDAVCGIDNALDAYLLEVKEDPRAADTLVSTVADCVIRMQAVFDRLRIT